MPASANIGAYRQVDVETTSQGKLIVMLFSGAIQRAEEAKRQLQKGKTDGVHNNLIRAQDIIAELRGALNMQAGEMARNLDRVYEYCQHLLVKANIRKSIEPIDECLVHLTSLRDTWSELFEKMAKDGVVTEARPINQHGASILNARS
jgi:flagellar protein FliS